MSAAPPAITSCAIDRVAGLYRERGAQLRRVLASPLESGQLDRCEAVLRSRIGGEHDLQPAGDALRARLDHRVIITLAAQQLGEQICVGARAAADLRRIGRGLAIRL